VADAVISAPQIQSTPAGYTVPAAQEIIVKSVRALVDGTGAGGSFTPTLQLLAPNGMIVWQAPAGSTLAAGASADISWFPGLGGQTDLSAVTAEWFWAKKYTNSTFASGYNDTYPFASLETSDATNITLGTFSHPNDCVQFAKAGIVLVGSTAIQTAFTQGVWEYYVHVQNAIHVSGAQSTQTNIPTAATLTGSFLLNPWGNDYIVPTAVPYQVYLNIRNDDSVSRTMGIVDFGGVWIPTGTLAV
jgi:hypothetical protein